MVPLHIRFWWVLSTSVWILEIRNQILLFLSHFKDSMKEVETDSRPALVPHLHPPPLHHPSRRSPTVPLPVTDRRRSGTVARPDKEAWWEWRRSERRFLKYPPAGSDPHRWNAAQTDPYRFPSTPPAIPRRRGGKEGGEETRRDEKTQNKLEEWMKDKWKDKEIW